MTPEDEGGGAGGTDAGGGGGAPAVREIESDYLSSFTSLLERFPPQLRPRDEGGGGDGDGDGGHSTEATSMRDSEDLVSFNGLEFFMDSQSGHILGTQMEIIMDWNHMEGDARMEEDGDSESECENYGDFLVRCEGDTDVEDCFPTPIQEVVVNLRNKTCGCFKWDLTGVPCKHAIAAIYMAREFPEDYVSEFFKKPMYEATYRPMIYPVPGPHDWVRTDTVDIEPPIFATKPGRKKKKRRPSAGEGQDGSGKIATITCGNCTLKGHRYTTCTQPLKPHLAIRKAGHRSNRTRPNATPAAPPPPPPPTAPAPPQHHPTTSAPLQRHPTSHAPNQRHRQPQPHGPTTWKLPSIRGIGTTRGFCQPRQNQPGSPTSRLYGYFTPGRVMHNGPRKKSNRESNDALCPQNCVR